MDGESECYSLMDGRKLDFTVAFNKEEVECVIYSQVKEKSCEEKCSAQIEYKWRGYKWYEVHYVYMVKFYMLLN